MSAGEEKTAHVAKKNGGEDLRRRTGVHGGGDDRGADGDVPGELGLEIDGVGGEVDVTGVEDDVVVRVAHAWERESGAAASGVTKAMGGGRWALFEPSGGGAGSRRRVPWPKSSLALKPSTSSMTMVVSILARLLDMATACAGGRRAKRDGKVMLGSGRRCASRGQQAASRFEPPAGRGEFHLFSPAVGPSEIPNECDIFRFVTRINYAYDYLV